MSGPRVIGIGFEAEKAVAINVGVDGGGVVALRVEQAQREEEFEVRATADVGIVAFVV